MSLSVEHTLRREEIYAALKRDILSCACPPGAALFEGMLADRFGVSKSPIRDALSRLAAERLVIVEPRKGYRVAPVSIADAAELFAFRALLEPVCVQSAAENASDVALAALDRFRSYGAWSDFVTYNREFHLTLLGLCPNKRMRGVAKELTAQFDRLVITGLSDAADRNHDALVAEHCAIIDAVQARDGRTAGKLIAKHIERAEKRVMKALSAAPVVP